MPVSSTPTFGFQHTSEIQAGANTNKVHSLADVTANGLDATTATGKRFREPLTDFYDTTKCF